MKYHIYHIFIIFTVLLFACGCSTHIKETPKAVQPAPIYVKAKNHYSHFMKAQLEKKKGNIDKAILNLNKAIKSDPESAYLKNELAILYLYQKDIKNGLKILDEVLKKDPNNVDALIMFGSIKQKQALYDDAKNAFQKVIENDPNQEKIYLLLSGIYMEENDLDSAQKVYQKLIQKFPSSYAGYFFLGKIYAEKGDADAAESKFLKTIELKPELIEPRLEMVALYEAKQSDIKTVSASSKEALNKKIANAYKGILEQHPENLRASMELGYHYHNIGMAKESKKLFKQLGVRSLSDQDVIRKVVQLYVEQKKYNMATTILEGMIEGAPDSSNLRFITGLTYYDEKKNNEKAIFHLKQVSPESRFYENAAIRIAFAYQQQGKNDEAIKFLKRVVKKVPDKVDLILLLCSFYEDLEQYKNAETELLKGIDLSPQSTKLHYRLGIIYDKWGKKDESIEKMRTVIKLDPEDANALNYLGYTLAEMGINLDEAEHLIKEALKHKPDDGYITDSLGWIYYKKKLFKDAVNVLKKAVVLVPDDPIILEHLGDAYIKTNNRKRALELYEKSLKQKKADKAALEKKINTLKMMNP